MHDTMQGKKTLSAVGLWWRWVLATIVGALLGYPLAIAACLAGFHYLGDQLVKGGVCFSGFGSLNCTVSTAIVVGAIVAGLFVGLAQYMVLRQMIKSSRWWILASTFGWTWVGFTATNLAYTPQFGFAINADGSISEGNLEARLPILLINCLWLLAAGALLGVLQTLVIRNGVHHGTVKRHAAWWIAVNGAMTIFMAIAIMAIFRGKGSLFNMLIFFVEFTPFYATISAAALAKMRLHRESHPI
ncbi:MAG: hypothetical protein NW214_03625 [Pseudanabaenaceae cyanobacterium bins.39]|nr:hypothetical protein [Pseudanabaenaceae cyanobacterium bins.39]